MKIRYEGDKRFDDKRYKIDKLGVAWYVQGWEIVETPDTEWTGELEKTGNIVAVMVGDDRQFIYDPKELLEILEDSYCGGCGQIGCRH